MMSNNIKISPDSKKLIVYLTLLVATFAVYWQVNAFDFINFDDNLYVFENGHIPAGITPDGIRWAFTTKLSGLWNPLVWLSFMFDYQLFGLNAGGYHLNNLLLHILSTLLLFWLFNRMTGNLWKSAFVAAFFALHPLHVESVAWIAERKDVLSAFFWMSTLCLYVYYTEKPSAGRYLSALLSFILALMSKPMVVTLPLVMILLDYWPLKRFESHRGNFILWQVKEKIPFFLLSAGLIILTLYAPDNYHITENPDLTYLPLLSRLANAPVAFVTYLGKTFYPFHLAVFYPFTQNIPLWQVLCASLLITAATAIIIAMAKSRPYLFAGWFWFAMTIAPVIGIIQISLSTPYAMADRYHYLPSIGLAIMMAWGIPSLISGEHLRKKILFPAGILVMAALSFITWNQCRYWKNTATIFNHTLQITRDNYMVHLNFGPFFNKEGNFKEAIRHYNEAIRINPDFVITYYNRGNAYAKLGEYRLAINDYNKAIQLKPDIAEIYNNLGCAYFDIGQHQQAIENFSRAIILKPNSKHYLNRASVYLIQGRHRTTCPDLQKACNLGDCRMLEQEKAKGYCF